MTDIEMSDNLLRDITIIVAVLALAGCGYSLVYMNSMSGQDGGVAASLDDSLQGMSDLEILIETGNRLMDSQQYMEAISHYTRALEIDSTLVDVRVDRGSCYFAVARNEDAKRDFEIALEQHPEHAIAYFNLGIVYGSLGDESQMVECWNKYLELDPDGELAERVRNFLQEHNLAESTDSI